MRAKKNEPFSNLGARIVCVVEKGASVTPATLGTKMTRKAFLTTSIEEIIPLWKRQCTSDKGKDKADSRSSNVWDNDGVALARAQETFTAEEKKVFSSTSPNEVVGRHLYKLVQVVRLVQIHPFFFLVALF